MKSIFLILTYVTILFSSKVFADAVQVSVTSSVKVLNSEVGRKTSLLKVLNPDEKNPMFVKIKVYHVESDSIGTGEEKLTEIKGKLKENDLIILPDKIAIPPNGKTNVRMIYTGDSLDEDRNYKVRFYPVTRFEYDGSNEQGSTSLFFSLSSTSFATVIKKDPNYNVKIDGDIISNNSDSLVLLNQCNVCNGKSCELYTEFRLPPQRTIDFRSLLKTGKVSSWQCSLNEPGLGKRVISKMSK